MEDRNKRQDELLILTANIVASHVSNNTLTVEEVPNLIEKVYSAFRDLSSSDSPSLPHTQPAVPIKKSIKPDYIVCLEDGKKLKMLKRHLQTHYNLSPEAYREKWNLPADYPMVAPNYAKHRRELAKKIGLGRSPMI